MITFPSAKVNLGLNIYNQRQDGFHNMETIMYPLLFSDMLEIIQNTDWKEGEAVFTLSGYGLPVEGNLQENLVFRAYSLLNEVYKLPPVRACLYKKIPMGAGLGGGSSDAAFMLKLLNVKFALGIQEQELETYASKLGSDCAFFIRNKPVYIYGKGHELESIEFSLQGWYMVLLNPGIHSSTAEAYQGVKKKEIYDPNNSVKAIIQQPVAMWKDKLYNQFEPSVFARYPELETIKSALYQAGATYASMSGSGSSLFGLFTSPPKLTASLQEKMVYQGWLS
ncbi:MAG: 4-(cytidine 5'-diphospho)-2-C-methyl-D-erythritol kinase [Bacteroidia bacterium]|jgi:4-diphosphocytidyl-2-C-methyl-D-erythritol kinase